MSVQSFEALHNAIPRNNSYAHKVCYHQSVNQSVKMLLPSHPDINGKVEQYVCLLFPYQPGYKAKAA